MSSSKAKDRKEMDSASGDPDVVTSQSNDEIASYSITDDMIVKETQRLAKMKKEESPSDEEEEEVPPTPSASTTNQPFTILSRQECVRNSIPGAFHAAPGQEPIRTARLPFSVVGAPSNATAANASTAEEISADLETGNEPAVITATAAAAAGTRNGSHQHLAEARAVQEEEQVATHTTLAVPVSEKDQNAANKKAPLWKHPYVRFGGLLFCVMVMAGIVLLILFGVAVFDKDEKQQEVLGYNHSSSDNTPLTSDEQYVLQILPEEFLPVLPNNTYYQLNTSIPQHKAFQWVTQDPMLRNYSHQRIIQRFILATMYQATNGDLWHERSNWLSYEKHECEWLFKGFFKIYGGNYTETSPCNADGEYERLWLNENNVRGTLPEELYSLTSLKGLSFIRSGHLTGTLSTKIGLLSKLELLSFAKANLIGTIPTELMSLSNLTILFFSKNDLSGTIPTEIGKLTKLEQLTLNTNSKMHGTIPSEIGLLTEMDIIIMAEINHLTSTIPSEVGTMSSLRFFFAGNNQLTGSLPTEFGLLRDKRLSWIHVQDNFLTGSFPSFLLSNMTRIGELNLTRNLFTGSIPTEIGWMTNLYRLQLSHNSFTGSIPSEMWTGPRQWRILSLGGNPELTGTIPDSLCYQAGNNTLELEFDCTGHLCGCNCSCLVT